MEKPFVVCHMFVSMDGKIGGAFMGHHAAIPARLVRPPLPVPFSEPPISGGHAMFAL